MRRIVFNAVVVLACLSALLLIIRSHHKQQTAARLDGHDDKSPEAKDRSIRRMRHFWSPFEKAIAAAKPASQPVQLTGKPQAIAATSQDIFRSEPKNHVSEEVVSEFRETHRQFRQVLDASFDRHGRLKQDGEKIYEGSGVVTIAGGEHFGPAIVGILMLRRLGSELPVEAFVANTTQLEKEICETVFPTLNARCLVVSDYLSLARDAHFDPSKHQLKSLAMLFSSFQHVLYMDPDTLPLLEPDEEMFLKQPYLSTGLVGWPDIWLGSESPLFYEIAGLPAFPNNLPAASSDSGQILLDKGRHLKTLLLATYYNMWGLDYYYPLLSQAVHNQGDTNTFESAATVLGLPWSRVHTPVKEIGRTDGGKFHNSALVQFHAFDDYKRTGKTLSRRAKLAVTGTTGHPPSKKIRPAFVRAINPNMNAGHLLDEGQLQDSKTHEHLRLWGAKKNMVELFGSDMEKTTFRYVIESGCKYVRMLKDWKTRGNICKKLMEHYNIVFYDS